MMKPFEMCSGMMRPVTDGCGGPRSGSTRVARRLAVRAILLLGLVAALLMAVTAAAQSSGQVYIRAFEDRNGNGVRDEGEFVLTRGIAVNLLNQDGVVVASALLDDSPNAANGLVGFLQMRAGDYTIEVTSAEYTPTTDSTFTVTVSDTGLPPVLEYGAQLSLDSALPTTDAEAVTPLTTREDQIIQVALASGGALTVMCGMVFLGLLIYLLTLRRAMNRARRADAARATTMTMEPVAAGTGQYPAARATGSHPPTATGQYPASSTERFRPPPSAETDRDDESGS